MAEGTFGVMSRTVSRGLPVIFLYVRLFFFGGVMKANGVILNYVVEKLQTTNMLVGWAFTLQCAIAYMISKYENN